MSTGDRPQQTVILLHGLGRTRLSMQRMEQALRQQGYQVINNDYPSRKLPIDALAVETIESSLQHCQSQASGQIHFVTHSLGGILVRQYTQLAQIPGLGRVVMLGPPNQGSEVVDMLRQLPGMGWWHGPAFLQLGTSDDDLPRQLDAVNFELGVIAGKRSMNLILSRLLPGQNDGKVSVDSTKVEGMNDFITLPCTHTFMMQNPQVIHQTLQFLYRGQFDHGNS